MTSTRFAKTPKPPYYAVMFTNQLVDQSTGIDNDEYTQTAGRMVELAQTMQGFLGVDSTRDGDGLGITVSYWQDEASIANWKANAEHISARQNGNQKWYEHYELRVAKIERTYDGPQHGPR